jgi:3-deoxy-D-manno-octulosonic acid (KDO) 8-phosphate synthase
MKQVLLKWQAMKASRTAISSARGIEAAEVLPCLSRVTTTLSIGVLMRLATAEIMRIVI